MKHSRASLKAVLPYLSVMFLSLAIWSWLPLSCFAAKAADKSGADVQYWLQELKNRKSDRKISNSHSPGAKSGNVQINSATTDLGTLSNTQDKAPKKISVDFYKVDLHNVFRLLGKVSGKNIVVDEGVKGTLTLALDNVPWPFVLDIIKNLKGLDSIEKNNTIMIYPKGKAIEWEGPPKPPGATGTLQVQQAKLKVTANKKDKAKLRILRKMHKSKTPLKQIMEAEELIKKAASMEKHGNMIGVYEKLKKAAQLWPDNKKLRDKLAALALERNEILEAYNNARAALKLDKQDSKAAVIAAVALARMGRTQYAKEYFEMAMNTKPTKDMLWNYAVFSFSQGNYRQALRLINRIAANYNITPDMMMLKARCYEYLSKTSQAIAEYRSILSAGNSLPPDMVEFARLRLSSLTGRAGSN